MELHFKYRGLLVSDLCRTACLSVSLRILLRNGDSSVGAGRGGWMRAQRFYYKELAQTSERLTGPKICSRQESQERRFQSESKGLRSRTANSK